VANKSFASKTSFSELDKVVETCPQAQRVGDNEASISSPRADIEGQDGSKVEAARIADAVLACETIDDLVGSATHVHGETIHSAPDQPSSLEAYAAVAAAAAAATTAGAAAAEVGAVPSVLNKEACASGPARSCALLVGHDSPHAESKNSRRNPSRKQSKARKKQQAGDNEAREKQEADDKEARKMQEARDNQARARQQTSDDEVAPEQRHTAFQVAAREIAVDNMVRARSASVGEGPAVASIAFAAGLFAMAAGGGIDAAATPDPNARRHAAPRRQQRRQHNTIQCKTQAGPARCTMPQRTPKAFPRRGGGGR